MRWNWEVSALWLLITFLGHVGMTTDPNKLNAIATWTRSFQRCLHLKWNSMWVNTYQQWSMYTTEEAWCDSVFTLHAYIRKKSSTASRFCLWYFCHGNNRYILQRLFQQTCLPESSNCLWHLKTAKYVYLLQFGSPWLVHPFLGELQWLGSNNPFLKKMKMTGTNIQG